MKVVGTILGWQLVVTVAAAALWLTLQGVHGALAALVGGGIATAGGWVYAHKMAQSTTEPAAMMSAHFRAEAYKLAITIALFACAFGLYREISPLPVFLTYVATLLVYWAALLIKS